MNDAIEEPANQYADATTTVEMEKCARDRHAWLDVDPTLDALVSWCASTNNAWIRVKNQLLAERMHFVRWLTTGSSVHVHHRSSETL